ncbi:MAG: hypothetical protein WDN03_00355 [Rhizomicrobium sp.]
MDQDQFAAVVKRFHAGKIAMQCEHRIELQTLGIRHPAAGAHEVGIADGRCCGKPIHRTTQQHDDETLIGFRRRERRDGERRGEHAAAQQTEGLPARDHAHLL